MVYHSGNQLINPHFLFEKIGLRLNMHLADFGSGKTGNLVFPAAAIVGERGCVYAVDIVKEALEGLAKRAALSGLTNIHTVWADIEEPNSVLIPPESLDAVSLVNFLSAIKKRDVVLEEAHRLLKSAGLILIVDWTRTGELSFAPAKNERVDWDEILRWGEFHQYILREEFAVGNYHKGLTLEKRPVI